MRLSTQKKKDLKENIINAKALYKPTWQEVRQAAKDRKKNRVSYDISQMSKKPVNRKKNRDLRRDRANWDIYIDHIVTKSHQAKPQYIGLPFSKPEKRKSSYPKIMKANKNIAIS